MVSVIRMATDLSALGRLSPWNLRTVRANSAYVNRSSHIENTLR
jgi:hypothetical protein